MSKKKGDQRPLKQNTARLISFMALLVIVIALGAFSYMVMRSFILPMFLAALLVVIFGPIDRWIYARCQGRRRTAALATTLVILLVVLVPSVWVLKSAVTEGAHLVAKENVWAGLKEKTAGFRKRFGLEIPFEPEIDQLRDSILRLVPTDQTAGSLESSTAGLANVERRLRSLETRIDGVIKSPDANSRELALAGQAMESVPLLQESVPEIRQAHLALADAKGLGQADLELETAKCRESILRLADRYRAFRYELLGGFPWASLVELANPSEEQFRSVRATAARQLRQWLLQLGGEAGEILISVGIGLAVMVLSIYYFIVDGPDMIRTAMRLSPLDDVYEEELLQEFSAVSRAVVLATLLSALAQGFLGFVGYAICGLKPLFLLTILTTLLAMVPFVGAAAVWVPATVYLAFIAEDQVGYAIFLGIWGFLLISMADNIIKPIILHGQSRLHPLLALLSVLGGVQAMGPIGIFVGPMVMSFFQALLNMLQKEIGAMEAS